MNISCAFRLKALLACEQNDSQSGYRIRMLIDSPFFIDQAIEPGARIITAFSRFPLENRPGAIVYVTLKVEDNRGKIRTSVFVNGMA